MTTKLTVFSSTYLCFFVFFEVFGGGGPYVVFSSLFSGVTPDKPGLALLRSPSVHPFVFLDRAKKRRDVKREEERENQKKTRSLVVAEPDGESLGVEPREVLLRRRVGHVGALPEALDADLAELGGRRVGVEALPGVEGHRGGGQQVERVLGLGSRRRAGVGGASSGGGGGRGSGGRGSLGRLRGLLRRRGVEDRRLLGQGHVAEHLCEGGLVDERVEPARDVGHRRAVRGVEQLGEPQPEVARAHHVRQRHVVAHEVRPRGEHGVQGGERLLDRGLRRGLLVLGVGPDAGDREVPGEQRGVDLSRAPVD